MTFQELQNGRGYHVRYRPGAINHCPGCGHSQWHVGRVSAECAFCGVSLDLPDSSRGEGTFTRGRGGRP